MSYTIDAEDSTRPLDSDGAKFGAAELRALKARLIAVKAALDSVDAALQAAVTANTTAIGTNTTNIAANTTAIAANTTAIAANATAAAAAQSTAAAAAATAAGNTASITSLGTSLVGQRILDKVVYTANTTATATAPAGAVGAILLMQSHFIGETSVIGNVPIAETLTAVRYIAGNAAIGVSIPAEAVQSGSSGAFTLFVSQSAVAAGGFSLKADHRLSVDSFTTYARRGGSVSILWLG